jgi:hypothetical protein
MPTLRQIVSDIASDLKAVNLDDRYSFRHLASKFRDKIAYFLRIEARSLDFLKEMGSWKPINCVELESIPVTVCGDIEGCLTLKRSKVEIPDAYETNFGDILKVTTIDGLQEFSPLENSLEYKSYLMREYPTGKQPFWIENKRIIIPNTTVEAVKVLLMPKNPIEVDILNCAVTQCTSPLDAEISYSQYLINLAKKEVLSELGAFKNVVEDEKGNDNTNAK